MRKSLFEKKIELRVFFIFYYLCVYDREGEVSGCNCEDEDGLEVCILFEGEGINSSDKLKY